MNRFIRGINIAVAALLVVFAATVYWYVWRPLPTVSGALRLPVSQPAQIVRDERGVPHITAANIDDAMFLQGYAHAQDRLWQMDVLRRLAAGELSEILGPATLEIDREARRLLMRRTAEIHAHSLHPNDRRILAAYARGVNHFMETHRGRMPVEFTLLSYDPRPWTIVDSILAGMQMFRSLTTTWRDEILKQSLLSKGVPDKVNYLFPVASGEEEQLAARAESKWQASVAGAGGFARDFDHEQLGSNAWAISGKLTASGKPILANDTHLEWAFPSPWYSIHLKTPELNVAGFSLPGLPAVIIGHNERVAWGITNLHYDVQDLYVEKLDPPSGRYVFQGQLQQARQERETIRVKGAQPVDLIVWVTRHGPIFQTSGSTHFAIRWAGAESGGFQFPMLEVDQAKNWDEFQKAWSRFTGPGSNIIYADVDGNIGYHAVGKLPIRKAYDGDLPVDGASGTSEWEGFIPFEQLPSAFNPPSGMLITANQNPFKANYAYRVNGNFSSHYRSRQIAARLKSRSAWKPEDMLPIETDIYSAFSHHLAQHVVKVWQVRGQNNPNLREAAELLKNWDGQMRPDAAAPLIVTLVYQQFRKAVADRASGGQGAAYDFQMAPVVLEKLLATRPAGWFSDFDLVLIKCFDSAIDEGKRLQGSNVSRWNYGRYTEFTLPHPVLSRLPYLGKRLFTIGPVPMAGASTTVKQTTRRLGPSMRFIADLSNWETSLHNITIGQSGQPLSSHFRDQWDAYYSGRSFPMQFGKVDARNTLQIQPLSIQPTP